MARKTSASLIIALLVLFGMTGCDNGTVSRTIDLPSDPVRSPIAVISPANVTTPIPLVIVLHGYGSNAFLQALYFSFASFVAEKKFHLVYLNGTTDHSGKRFWNASPSCCDLDHSSPDDVGYISRVIDRLKSSLAVSKVYIGGHSNGGFMAYRMACEQGDKISGVFSLAGMDEKRTCKLKKYRGFRVVHIHGMDDRVISPNGGSFRGLPAYTSLPQTLEIWEKRFGCKGVSVERMDYSLRIPGEDSTLTTETCKDQNRLALIRIIEGSHIPFINSAFRNDVLNLLLHD